MLIFVDDVTFFDFVKFDFVKAIDVFDVKINLGNLVQEIEIIAKCCRALLLWAVKGDLVAHLC